jgi:hypothetical protein
MSRARSTSPVPTSRDAIESWLDVLVSMLSLSKTHKTQVRDELEDHLRSRVDDLLILGKPEPEAIQTAIHELGETAELAKLISSASRTGTSFRRFVMNATFFVLAGSILTASVSMMMPASTTLLPQTTTAIVLDDHDHNPSTATSIDTRNATISDLFKGIADATDKPVIIHWELIRDIGYEQDTPLDIDADPISAALTLTILKERAEMNISDSIAVLEEEEHIEIGLRSQFDRRTTEKRIYDLSGFADTISQANQASMGRGGISTYDLRAQRTTSKLTEIVDLLMTHVSTNDWTQMGGDLASLSVLNTTLVVSAPERMHQEIESLLEELQEQHQAQVQDRLDKRMRAMQRVRAEFEHAKQEYLMKSNELDRLQSRTQNLNVKFVSSELDEDEEQRIRDEIADLRPKIQVLQLEVDEAEIRYGQYQSMLIAAEQDQIMSELN